MAQHAAAQLADAPVEARFLLQQPLAVVLQLRAGFVAEARGMLGQPRQQAGFGGLQHRGDIPQGVVEVEGDQAQGHGHSPL
ncbi:hypothetical protein D3C86_1720040 [compost metagenome]